MTIHIHAMSHAVNANKKYSIIFVKLYQHSTTRVFMQYYISGLVGSSLKEFNTTPISNLFTIRELYKAQTIFQGVYLSNTNLDLGWIVLV